MPAGVAVSLYADGALAEVYRTNAALFPGQIEHFGVSWDIPAGLQNTAFPARVVVDDVGDGSGEHNECEDGGEDNNDALLEGIRCGAPT